MISKYIKENKIFASLASIWLLINFVMWSMPGNPEKSSYSDTPSKQFFYPNNGYYLDYPNYKFFSISERWDLPEVLAYGVGAILLYIFLQIVFKATISKVKKG